MSKLGKLVLELRGDKLDSEQIVLVTERTDQPKITDFFKPVSPKVHELATNRDRVQGLERRLKEAALLKARLEKENDNLRAKNAKWRKKSRPDSAADSSIPRTTEASGVKTKSKKLEDRITNPNTPVKDSPAKPKTSSSQRPVVAICASHLVMKPSKALRLSLKRMRKKLQSQRKSQMVRPRSQSQIVQPRLAPNLHSAQRERKE